MSYSFEYIDIILLAMIAGFIFLRLRGILGKRTGFEGKVPSQFEKVLNNIQTEKKVTIKENFDEESQKEFLKGAKIAYETIITDFSDNDNKLIASKPLLSKKIDKILNVTVDFVSEVITCIKDKDKKVISGDPEKIKKIYDTWVFSRDTRSSNPNWQLVDTLT
jgi:predicted lipid-binding transport protein (Tim44 family)